MPQFARQKLLTKFRGMIDRGGPIISGGAGTGLCAKWDEADADIIVCHLGLTTGGGSGTESGTTLEASPALLDEWAAARSVREDVIVLVHGGGVSMPDDADFVLNNTTVCHGFYGASFMERLPVEQAFEKLTEAFKA